MGASPLWFAAGCCESNPTAVRLGLGGGGAFSVDSARGRNRAVGTQPVVIAVKKTKNQRTCQTCHTSARVARTIRKCLVDVVTAGLLLGGLRPSDYARA